MAVCVLREGHLTDELELGGFLAEKMTRYKLPRRIFFWDALPKSGYGKVPKRLIKEQLEERGELPLAPVKGA